MCHTCIETNTRKCFLFLVLLNTQYRVFREESAILKGMIMIMETSWHDSFWEASLFVCKVVLLSEKVCYLETSNCRRALKLHTP